MAVCEKVETQSSQPVATWSPICCGHSMHELVRRMMVLNTGQIVFASVWNCGQCGRLLL